MQRQYATGSQLTLSVRKRGADLGVPEQRLTVEIIAPTSDPTMSVALKVFFRDARTGEPRLAFLKMYDRRFSPEMRQRYSPLYDDDAENAWHQYVRDGKAPALFAFLDENIRRAVEENVFEASDSDTDPESSDDEKENQGSRLVKKSRAPRTAQEMFVKKGKREGILQWKAWRSFKFETRAYETLSHFQGQCIPRLLAQVCLTLEGTSPPDLSERNGNAQPAHRGDYFKVPGILLEYIDGFNLVDLAMAGVPRDKWHDIIQKAVDAAGTINKAGLVNLDCQPRNVVVQRETLQPFHIDFAQAAFAEDMSTKHYKEKMDMEENQGAIGVIMNGKLQRDVGIRIPEIRYMDGLRGWI